MSSGILHRTSATTAVAPHSDGRLDAAHARAVAELDMERRMVEDRIRFPIPHLAARAPWTRRHALRCAAAVEAALLAVLLTTGAGTDPGRLVATVPAALLLGGLVVLAVNIVVIPYRNERLDAANGRIDERNESIRIENRRMMAELVRIDERRAGLDAWFARCAATGQIVPGC